MAGIYIHIPFCKQKCHYCDFHFSTSLKWKDEMIKALVKELELRKDELGHESVETIYLGGGTPSILTIDELQLLLNEVYRNYNVVTEPEITLEANPDDLTTQKINEFANTPINRLSIGIQSFFDEDLQFMNRAHNAEEAHRSLLTATQYFSNITIDLIYGIPKMSTEHWKKNLAIAFESGVHHISSYALTVEPKTALAGFIKKGKYPPVSEELALEHFNILMEETAKQGFVQYEISNFGKPDFFSRHNTSYWQGKKYLGIGPSAHSFDGKNRSWNISNNIKYIGSLQKQVLPCEKEFLSRKDRFNETVMTGLRTIWGVSLSEIEQQFGELYKKELVSNSRKFIEQELLVLSYETSARQTLKVSQKGKFLCDGIASELFVI